MGESYKASGNRVGSKVGVKEKLFNISKKEMAIFENAYTKFMKKRGFTKEMLREEWNG